MSNISCFPLSNFLMSNMFSVLTFVYVLNLYLCTLFSFYQPSISVVPGVLVYLVMICVVQLPQMLMVSFHLCIFYLILLIYQTL